jgi:hypothetical protein
VEKVNEFSFWRVFGEQQRDIPTLYDYCSCAFLSLGGTRPDTMYFLLTLTGGGWILLVYTYS